MILLTFSFIHVHLILFWFFNMIEHSVCHFAILFNDLLNTNIIYIYRYTTENILLLFPMLPIEECYC